MRCVSIRLDREHDKHNADQLACPSDDLAAFDITPLCRVHSLNETTDRAVIAADSHYNWLRITLELARRQRLFDKQVAELMSYDRLLVELYRLR